MPPSRILLEVSVGCCEDALAAEQAGADRLELCRALELGGLTPSLGLLRQVRVSTELPLVVLIRPQPGGFVYSDADLRVMRLDLRYGLEEGADGFVVGVLTPSRTVDEESMAPFVGAAAGREVVFHRAFDEVADPFLAVEQLARLGVQRILTSGQAPTALDGVGLLCRLIEFASQPEILPAAGIRADNVAEIVRRTGCSQVHGTFRDRATGRLDAREVRRVRAVLDAL